jgi:hypothetical protein
MKVALIESKPSRTDFVNRFDNAFEFERFALCSDASKKKILKADVDIEINTEDYDWLILVGSDSLKYFTKINSITEYSGRCVEDKYLPVINPAMLAFKPEAKPMWEESKNNIINFISGKLKVAKVTEENAIGIDNTEEAKVFIQNALDHENQHLTLRQQDYIQEMDI